MADETVDFPDPGGPTIPNRDRRREPEVIEGEFVAPGEGGDEPRAAAGGAPEPPIVEPALAEPPPFAAARPILSAAIGALVGAAVAGGGVWFLNRHAEVSADFASRLDNIDKAASASNTALGALDQRVSALEAAAARAPDKNLADAFGQRIAALESAALSAKAAADANEGALAEARAARAAADTALGLATSAAQIASAAPPSQSGNAGEPGSALEGRVARLETGLAALDRPPVDLGPVNQRLDTLEGALAAPKSQTRAPAEAAPPRRDGAGLAVVAQALADRLRAGAPFARELAALERLGADPARLAALKPFADKGASTSNALAADFEKIAPTLATAAADQPAGAVDRLLASMSRVVRVTPVGEVAGDDPSAVLSRIDGALRRGQIAQALAAWERLPEAARRASQEWADAAKGRLAADEAAQGLLDEAIARLGAAGN